MTTLERQKIAAYKYAIAQIRKYYPLYYHRRKTLAPFVCDLLREYWADKVDPHCHNREIMVNTIFTEFKSCKPGYIHGPGYWEESDLGYILRIAALEWCINQLTPIKQTK